MGISIVISIKFYVSFQVSAGLRHSNALFSLTVSVDGPWDHVNESRYISIDVAQCVCILLCLQGWSSRTLSLPHLPAPSLAHLRIEERWTATSLQVGLPLNLTLPQKWITFF